MSSCDSTENKQPASSQDLPLSSPQSSLSQQRHPPSYRQNGRKERRNPSITPKKFSRFFTPRSQRPQEPISTRPILNDITAPSNNRRGVLSSPIRFNSRAEKDENPSTFPRNFKKRKLLHTPDDTPNDTYAESKGHGGFEGLRDRNQDVLRDEDQDEDLQNIQSSPCERAAHVDQVEEGKECVEPLQRIVSIDERGLGGKLLQSMSGLPTRSRRQHHAYPVNGNVSPTFEENISNKNPDWQDETASFYSRPDDVHMCTGLMGPHRVIPFCAVGCNSKCGQQIFTNYRADCF
jgi:hypothetical protein